MTSPSSDNATEDLDLPQSISSPSVAEPAELLPPLIGWCGGKYWGEIASLQ